MFKKTVIAASLGLALSSAAQAEYQFDLAANSHTGESKAGSATVDQDSYGLTGAYYLGTVNTTKGPLAEAAFLDRASSIKFDFSTGELDGEGIDADIDSYAVEGRLVSKASGWLVDLGYRLDEIDNGEIDTYSIGAGKYVLENTAVVVSYDNTDSDFAGESDTYGLGVEHLWHLEQGAIKLDAEVAMVDHENRDDVDVWGLGGTYYVNPSLGFGADFARSDSNETELEEWSLFAKWFVTEKVALELAYTESQDAKFGLESDAVMFSANVRF